MEAITHLHEDQASMWTEKVIKSSFFIWY